MGKASKSSGGSTKEKPNKPQPEYHFFRCKGKGLPDPLKKALGHITADLGDK